MIDSKTIDEIYNRADIVEVVSDFVSLRKAGVNYKGLCPFHNEKTPSFVVSPSKGICHCFSCGKGGNVIHFLMEHEQMTYPEALRWLAQKYNIRIEEKELSPQELEARGKRESLFIVNEWANNYFQDNLYNNDEGVTYGLGYLRNRGLRDDIIRKFQLGYCLQQNDALGKTAIKQGYKEEFLIETGLCSKRENGTLYDKYHGRIIFPVHNLSGKVVAFGGRILSNDKKAAKYINSPESEIYHKSFELYGIHEAKRAITQKDRCYLVEGYMDVISMHQCGIENVVASSGTSLTEGQIRMLHRFTSNITVLYDGDPAGIHASLRGINMLLEEGMNIKVLLLPDGDDPDSFARKHNAAEYQEYMESHQEDFLTFKTRVLLKDAQNDIHKRSEVINDIIESISLIPDAVTRSVYIQECSRLLNVKEEVLVMQTADKRASYSSSKERRETVQNDAETPPQSETDTIQPTQDYSLNTNSNILKMEKEIIKLIVLYGKQTCMEVELSKTERAAVSVIDYIQTEFNANNIAFTHPLYQKMWSEALEHSDEENFNPSSYFCSHHDLDISKTATSMMGNDYQLSDWFKHITLTPTYNKLSAIVPTLIQRLKMSIVEEKILDIRKKMGQTDSNDTAYISLMKDFQQLIKIKKELAQKCRQTNISL